MTAMINSAQNYPISSILDIEANVKFVVPKYQREYIWRRRDWEKLFDDIWDNFDGHYLGSIICINRANDAYQTQELELAGGADSRFVESAIPRSGTLFKSHHGIRSMAIMDLSSRK
jgi:Protein of unknown function DUF262